MVVLNLRCHPADELWENSTIRRALGWRRRRSEVGSKIRRDGRRDRGVLFGAVSMWVFGTDAFRPFADDMPIGFRRGPRRREDAVVFDGELELQCLALVVGIGRPPFTNGAAASVLFAATLPCFPGGFVIDEPIAFHDVQGVSVRRIVLVDRGK